MIKFLLRLSFLFLALPLPLPSQVLTEPDMHEKLMRDLEIVEYWNKKINQRVPVTYNHFLHGGYFTMPSARMGESGEIGFGYSWVPPYINWNLRCQLTYNLEVSGNYRIFRGVEDPILTPMGFGDMSDKGANIKWGIFLPEDSQYELPGIALGIEDFMGTKTFLSQYVIMTKVWPDFGFEASLGYGWQRLHRWFGGASWKPFLHCDRWFLRGVSFEAEYDCSRYESEEWEKHPKGHKVKSRINYGVKYRLGDFLDVSLSYIRGCKLACSASLYYNFGECQGFLPKIEDSLPYTSPVNIEPLGKLRPPQSLVQDLVYAFRDQGFRVLETWITFDNCCRKILWISAENQRFRCEYEVKDRFNHMMAYLIPSDIDKVCIVLEADGFPIQEYRYRMDAVKKYANCEIGVQELNLLTRTFEASYPNPYCSTKIFKQHREQFNIEVMPKTNTFFGSSKGKFKFALGIHTFLDGYVFNDIYYSALLGYVLWHNLYEVKAIDRLNPSQIVNVRTDIVDYYKQKGVTLDAAYLQKNWNLGCGWYTRLSLGYFEEEYAGVAGELLYFPVLCSWAVGVEGAWLKKRRYSGLGFTDKFRKYDGWYLSHVKFHPSQFFVDLYYNWKEACLDLKVQAGKFLANDWGVRYEVSRYFPSGMQISIWYTYTNGRDKINGHTYYDKGIAFSMPLDIFYLHSSREKWGYGMSAWLRDVGQKACTGRELYPTIYSERK